MTETLSHTHKHTHTHPHTHTHTPVQETGSRITLIISYCTTRAETRHHAEEDTDAKNSFTFPEKQNNQRRRGIKFFFFLLFRPRTFQKDSRLQLIG